MLLRHGQTEWNVQGRYQGQQDSPLTAQGQTQVRAVAALVAPLLQAHTESIEYWVSPLGRAQQSKEIFCEAAGLSAASFTTVTALQEMHFGTWGGKTKAEVQQANRQVWQAREADKWHYRLDGGESYADVQQRLTIWIASHVDGRLDVGDRKRKFARCACA